MENNPNEVVTPKTTSNDETRQAPLDDGRAPFRVDVPRPSGSEPTPLRRGRPKKIDGSPRRNPDLQRVGEVEFRKPAADISNLHAAFDRIAEQEKAIYTRKCELSQQYEREYKKKLRVVEPTHMLDTKTAAEQIPIAQGKALARGLYSAPAALLGVEARPRDEELSMLGEAIVDLSKYHAFADAEWMTWLGFGFAMLACFTPAAIELRAKKAGTWEVDKLQLAAAGYLPGVRV